jgi:ASC-1-like (ASCH) protein
MPYKWIASNYTNLTLVWTKKTVKGRLHINKWTKVKPRVTCSVYSPSSEDNLDVNITSVINAPSFQILYKMYGSKLLPTVKKEYKDEPLMVYSDFYDILNRKSYL